MSSALPLDQLAAEDYTEIVEDAESPYWHDSNDANVEPTVLDISTVPIDCYSLSDVFIYQFSGLNDVCTCLSVEPQRLHEAIQSKKPLKGVKFAVSHTPYTEVGWQVKARKIAEIKSPALQVPIDENRYFELESDPVECYKANGHFLYRFRNIKDASESLCIDAVRIRNACLFEKRGAYGLCFNISILPYEEGDQEVRIKTIEKILALRMKTYGSTASSKVVSTSKMTSSIKNSDMQSGKVDDKPIDCSQSGEFLFQFRNLNDAAVSLGIDANLIRKVCLNQKNSVSGLKFSPSSGTSEYQQVDEETKNASILKIKSMMRRGRLAAAAVKKSKEEEEEEEGDSEDSEHSSGSGYCITEHHRQPGDSYESSLRRRLRRYAEEEIPPQKPKLGPKFQADIPDIVIPESLIRRRSAIQDSVALPLTQDSSSSIAVADETAAADVVGEVDRYACEDSELYWVEEAFQRSSGGSAGTWDYKLNRYQQYEEKQRLKTIAAEKARQDQYPDTRCVLLPDLIDGDYIIRRKNKTVRYDQVYGEYLRRARLRYLRKGAIVAIKSQSTLSVPSVQYVCILSDYGSTASSSKDQQEQQQQEHFVLPTVTLPSIESLTQELGIVVVPKKKRPPAPVRPVSSMYWTMDSNFEVNDDEEPKEGLEGKYSARYTPPQQEAPMEVVGESSNAAVSEMTVATSDSDVVFTELKAPDQQEAQVSETNVTETETQKVSSVVAPLPLESDVLAPDFESTAVKEVKAVDADSDTVNHASCVAVEDIIPEVTSKDVSDDKNAVDAASDSADLVPGNGVVIDMEIEAGNDAPSGPVTDEPGVINISAEEVANASSTQTASSTLPPAEVTSEFPHHVMVYNGREILQVRVEDFILNTDDHLIQLLADARGDTEAALALLDGVVAQQISEQFSLPEVQAYLKGVAEFRKDMQIFRRTPLLKKKSYKSLVNFHYKFYWFSVPNLSEVVTKSMLLNVFRCASSFTVKKPVVVAPTRGMKGYIYVPISTGSAASSVSDTGSTASEEVVDKGVAMAVDSSDTTVPMESTIIPAEATAVVTGSTANETAAAAAAAGRSLTPATEWEGLLKELTSSQYDLVTSMKAFMLSSTTSNNRNTRSMSPATTESVVGEESRVEGLSNKPRGRQRSNSTPNNATGVVTASSSSSSAAAKRQKTTDTLVTGGVASVSSNKKKALTPTKFGGSNFLTPVVAKDPDTNETLLVYRSALHCGVDLNMTSADVVKVCLAAEGENITKNIKLQFYDGPRLRFEQSKIPADQLASMEETVFTSPPTVAKPPKVPNKKKQQPSMPRAVVPAVAPAVAASPVQNARSGIVITPPIIRTHGVSPLGLHQHLSQHLHSTHHLLFEILRGNDTPPEGLTLQQLTDLLAKRMHPIIVSDRVKGTLDNLVSMKLVVDNAGRYFMPKNTSPQFQDWLQKHELAMKMTLDDLEKFVDDHNVVGWLVQLMRQCSSHATFQLAYFKSLFSQVSNLPPAFKFTSINMLGVTMMALNKGVNMQIFEIIDGGYSLTRASYRYRQQFPDIAGPSAPVPVTSSSSSTSQWISTKGGVNSSSGTSSSFNRPTAVSVTGGFRHSNTNASTTSVPKPAQSRDAIDRNNSSSSNSGNGSGSMTSLAEAFYREKELLMQEKLKESFYREKQELAKLKGSDKDGLVTDVVEEIETKNAEEDEEEELDTHSNHGSLSDALFETIGTSNQEDEEGMNMTNSDSNDDFDAVSDSLFDAYGL